MSTPTAAADPVESALTAFLNFRDEDMELWRRAGGALDLSMSAMLMLATILRADAADEPLRQVDLVKRLHLSPASVSASIDVLEDRRLVQRIRSARDRRSVQLRAGADAEPIAREVMAADDAFRQVARSVSEEGLAGFVEVLDAMRAVGAAKYT